MFDIEYNKVSARSIGILCNGYPEIPASEEEAETYEIPGRDGDLISGTGKMKDIKIEIPMGFRSPAWMESFRDARRWLYGKENRELYFSDDPDFFYKVKKVTINTAEREVRKIGKFSADFLCEGYQYLKSGKHKYKPEEVIKNAYAICHPTFFITGEGVCFLTINGKSLRMNVGQNLTINTELQIAYRYDGSIINTTVTGDYEDAYLIPGENEIRISSGFTLDVIPNWRSL